MKIKSKISVCFIAWLLLFFNSALYSQSDFSITEYTSKSGLLQNSVEAMVMDSNNFLWIASENGLIRFDGIHFKAFLNEGNPVNLFGMSQTLSGDIVCYDSQSGCYLIHNNKVTTLREMNRSSINYMLVNGVLPNKEFYLQKTDKNFKHVDQKNWLYSPVTLFTRSENEFFIRTKKGIAHYLKNELHAELDLSNFKPKHFLEINGNIYFFSSTNQIYRIDINSWTAQKCSIFGALGDNYLANKKINNVFWNYNSSDPCLQIDYSLYALKTGKNPTTIYTESITDNLPHNCLIVSAIYLEKQHMLAVGTDTKGLILYKKKSFKTIVYDAPESNTNNAYYCQVELDSDRIYTDWSREFSLAGASKSKLPIVRDYSDPLFRDNNGVFWYMYKNSLMKYKPKDAKPKEIHGNTKEYVFAFSQDSDSILVGLSNGLGYIKNDSIFKFLNIRNEEVSSNIFMLFRWINKSIWYASYSGVFQYNPKNGKVDTLAPLYLKDPYSITLCDDFILIGTYGNGYYIFKDGRTVKMPMNKSNSLRYVNSMIRDKQDFLWISTNQGLVKTKLDNLKEYFKDTTSTVFYVQYGEEDGISNTEFNGGNSPNYIALKNGYFSLPTMDGLVWFNPLTVNDPSFNTPLKIEEIYYNDSLISLNQSKLVIPAHVNKLRFSYTTPFWGNETNLLIQYKLEGYSRSWLNLNSNQNFIEFSNLHAGSYTLRLRKFAGWGKPKFIEIAIPFVVEKQFYEKTGFILICILLALLIVFGVARIYAFNIKVKNLRLEKSVQQRTTELSKANDELKQSIDSKDKLISIISHDIITPLRFITMVAQKGAEKNSVLDKTKIQMALSDIRNTSQKLHDNAQNILSWIKHQNKRIAVNKNNVAVAALVDKVVQQYVDLAAARGTLIVNSVTEDDIIKTDATILSIILNNLLSNACKFTNNGKIEISAEQSSSTYCIQIKDSGSGIRPKQLERISTILKNKGEFTLQVDPSSDGNGLGYIIIGELVDLLNASLEIKSTTAEGTCIRILLKLS